MARVGLASLALLIAAACGGGGAQTGMGGAGGSGGNAGSTGGSGNIGATGGVPAGLLDPTRTTTWNPGILADDQMHMPLGTDGLPVRTTVCASPAPGADINAAITACPEGQVVKLAAGTYTVSATIKVNKGVVLRGAGSQGAAMGGTTIVKTGGNSVIQIGSSQDQACYASNHGTAIALAEDAVKETTTIRVASGASGFAAGDLALVDEADDSPIQEGDCQYFKRVDKRSVSERVEIASVDAAAGTLTLSSPLHWTFRPAAPHGAQIAKVSGAIVRWAGIEGIALQGGTNPNYNGQMAGGIDVSNAANCWIKDVQTDGTIAGMHVALTGTFRTVVRDSYFHHSAKYDFGADCYGIVL
ncbi:MAG TPA: glycosyl hydrolase family 28-related protein, partial [Polyangia bacterium]|nr:glycosyl hydrolase family 28-related protein [Polyangia bacterium]